MFSSRVRALMIILLIAGLASFYDFLLFFDGHRSWLASGPQVDAPLIFYAMPFLAVSRNLLSLIGSTYAPLGLMGLFSRAALLRSAISAAAVLQIFAAALTFVVFGSLARVENALPHILFAVIAALWANGSEASKHFAPSAPAAAQAKSPLSFGGVFVRGCFFAAILIGYPAAAYYFVEPAPAPAVYERLRAMPVRGEYRTIYKYSVFVPEGYVMHSSASASPAPSGSEASAGRGGYSNRYFGCVLGRGDDRILISDNRMPAMDKLRSFALFFGLPSGRDFLKAIVNERFGIVPLVLRRILRGVFNREAVTPHFTGFCSADRPSGPGGEFRPGFRREFDLWDGDASNSVLAVFSNSAAAFDEGVISAVVSTLKLEDRVKSAADYFSEGVKLYGSGRVEEAKYSFASALYYNFSDYSSHYYIARCFHETGASDAAVVFHLNNAVKMISANRFFTAGAGAAPLKPLSGPADIKSAMEELSKHFAAGAQTAAPLPGFFY